jgi:hypothetical protein
MLRLQRVTKPNSHIFDGEAGVDERGIWLWLERVIGIKIVAQVS